MSLSDAGAKPVIDTIDPSRVKQNFEGPINLYGRNFSRTNYVFVDAHSPVTRFVDATNLQVVLTIAETNSPGNRTLRIHDADSGDFSNEVILVVER